MDAGGIWCILGRMEDGLKSDDLKDAVAPYPQEALLVEAVAEMGGRRVVCSSPGLGQLAGAVARTWPAANVVAWYLDLYRAELSRRYWNAAVGVRPENLAIECEADLPAGDADVVALPLSSRGEAELVWDLVQSGHERLVVGGKFFAATENAEDRWLGEQLAKVFRKVERRELETGVVYLAVKTEPLKKRKDYSCEFAFRDRGRLIKAVSRPGVFSHRHIDPGARRLIDAMEVVDEMRVLDIGCGAGTVALAAACRVEEVRVHAVDSNARAVECTLRGAELNGLTNVTVELNASGGYGGTGEYDLVLANPPYYSGFRIAEHFLVAGRESLRTGGKILVVTKHPAWYEEHMPAWFDDVTMVECKGYCVFNGARPACARSQEQKGGDV
jgi:16S rRNA G1207 methylase RsmC